MRARTSDPVQCCTAHGRDPYVPLPLDLPRVLSLLKQHALVRRAERTAQHLRDRDLGGLTSHSSRQSRSEPRMISQRSPRAVGGRERRCSYLEIDLVVGDIGAESSGELKELKLPDFCSELLTKTGYTVLLYFATRFMLYAVLNE